MHVLLSRYLSESTRRLNIYEQMLQNEMLGGLCLGIDALDWLALSWNGRSSIGVPAPFIYTFGPISPRSRRKSYGRLWSMGGGEFTVGVDIREGEFYVAERPRRSGRRRGCRAVSPTHGNQACGCGRREEDLRDSSVSYEYDSIGVAYQAYPSVPCTIRLSVLVARPLCWTSRPACSQIVAEQRGKAVCIATLSILVFMR